MGTTGWWLINRETFYNLPLLPLPLSTVQQSSNSFISFLLPSVCCGSVVVLSKGVGLYHPVMHLIPLANFEMRSTMYCFNALDAARLAGEILNVTTSLVVRCVRNLRDEGLANGHINEFKI